MRLSIVLFPVIAALSSFVAAEPEPIAAGDADAPIAPSEPIADMMRRHLPEEGMIEVREPKLLSHHHSSSNNNNTTNSSAPTLEPRSWVSLVGFMGGAIYLAN